MCRSYGDQFEILLKDKRDISSYLKKQLDLRNEQVFELNDRLIGLQKVKENERDFFEKKFDDFKIKSQSDIEKLENENMLLSNRSAFLPRKTSDEFFFFHIIGTRLIGLEEFKTQRQTMETTIDDLKTTILKKEQAYRNALQQMEIALISFKNRSDYFQSLNLTTLSLSIVQIKKRSDCISE